MGGVFFIFHQTAFSVSAHISDDRDFHLAETSRTFLEIYINEQSQNLLFDCYYNEKGEVWVKKTDLEKLDLPFIHKMERQESQSEYLSLSELTLIQYRMNPKELTLRIEIPTHYLPQTDINLSGPNCDKIRPEHPGLFLNYDISAQHTTIASNSSAAFLTEVGYFNQFGVGTTDFFVQIGNPLASEWVRLDTTWTYDVPENIETWNIGDSVTSTASWSGSVRFAGIQWGTNFNTQPYLVTFPLPAFSGQAVVPSTLNVFVNDALNVTEEIKNGPFTLHDIPVVTGAGTVKVVTNDVLGRQRENVIPYYTSQELLKEDLIDFSYEFGIIRNNYGINSFDYSEWVGVGTYNKGMSTDWTLGAHAEILAEQQTLGFSTVNLWNQYFLLNGSVAVSHSELGWGTLFQVGLQRQTPNYTYGFLITPSSSCFTDLAFVENLAPPTIQMQSFFTISSERFGTFSSSYTYVQNRIFEPLIYETNAVQYLPNAKLLTVSYSQNVAKNLYFTLGGMFDFNESDNTVTFASLVWGFKENYSLTSSVSFQNNDNQQTLLLNKNVPWGNGDGYYISLSNGSPQQGEGFYTYNNDYGTYSAQISQIGKSTNYLAEVSGSLVRFAGYTLASRTLYNSFALIRVEDSEDVCVYNRNTCVGTTNKKGILLVPNLLPYQNNTVNLDIKEFPLTAELPILEQGAIPYYRSGIFLDFPVSQVTYIEMKLVFPDNQRVPQGARVQLFDDHEIFYVVNEGDAYLTRKKHGQMVGHVSWDEGECQFIAFVPAVDATVIKLGNITCS